MSVARAMWLRLETLHALTYFADESIAAARRRGLKGFWMGYFGFRAAPMGAPSAAVVEAAFGNFAPWMVRRAIPDAWRLADPADLVRARSSAAAAALRRSVPELDIVAPGCAGLLRRVVDAADPLGRALFASNAALELPDDPFEQIWQLATTLREHRGDCHLQLLATAGLDGCEVHVLHASEHATPAEVLRDNRGWSHDDWAAATERLRTRGLLDESALSGDGRRLRRELEAETDRLAGRPYASALDDDEQQHLLDALTPVARTIAQSHIIPYPNPIGLTEFL